MHEVHPSQEKLTGMKGKHGNRHLNLVATEEQNLLIICLWGDSWQVLEGKHRSHV